MPRKIKVSIPDALPWEVWERDDFTCRYCGARRYLQADHRIPESQGGPMTAENLVTLCGACNRRKGAKTHDEYEWLVCLKLAALHLAKQYYFPRGSPIPDSHCDKVISYAKTFLYLRMNREICAPLGDHFVPLRNASPALLAELIDDRVANGKHAEAARYSQMAVEKYGPDYRSFNEKAPVTLESTGADS